MSVYESDNKNKHFQITQKCPGTFKIKQILTIDDGTGKTYEYELDKNLTWKEYTINPSFINTPEEPTIRDNVIIEDKTEDPYNVIQEKGIRYDFGQDGTKNDLEKGSTTNIILTKPHEQEVIQYIKYFTGFEIKEVKYSKIIKKTNIAPTVCNTIEENGVCSPKHIFTSCSIDPEDTDPTKLKIDWKLYKDNNAEVYKDEDGVKKIKKGETEDWIIIKELNDNPVFEYIYQEEGRYKLIEYATDIDGDTNSAERIYDVFFEDCSIPDYNDNYFRGKGSIEVEPGKYQIIAMPLENMYWDENTHSFKYDKNIRSTIYNSVVKQLEDRYNRPAKELFKVANCYIGDINKFYNYIPGFTKETSEHNFPLVYIDTDDDVGDNIEKKEIVGFWIKSIVDFAFTIKWEIK